MSNEAPSWQGREFCRYSATGNTFLIFDNRKEDLSTLEKGVYASWCSKHNVDGLLFVENPQKSELDFHMRYLNADGGEVEMCGNGARSILHFYSQVLGEKAKAKRYRFSTQKGEYLGESSELFPIQMTELREWGNIDVSDLYSPQLFSDYLNTGVPHALYEVSNSQELQEIQLQEVGSKIRYDERFERGVNANFFCVLGPGHLRMRTYERGVEGETLSCGTGATAVALSVAKNKSWASPIRIEVGGGTLEISFNQDFSEVFLAGPVDLLERNTLKA